MARIYRTTDGDPPVGYTEGLWVYNGLDCCITKEVLDVIRPKLNEITSRVYAHELSLQGPILEMECRGVLVNQERRAKVLGELEAKREFVLTNLTAILEDGLDWRGNVNSPIQLQSLLYEVLGLPHVRHKGQITTNRKALEKLRANFYAEPIINHILAVRDLNKKIGVLRTGIDADGRIRTSYNIAGTDTGRLSSYQSAFGSGTNLQNITGSLRDIFEADPGKKLGYIDLEQAESRAVGAIIWNLFHDSVYLDFCESGDLHTGVSMMTWETMDWFRPITDLQSVLSQLSDPVARKHNKTVAGQKFYREFTFRDSSKRLGHGTNYEGKPEHMSKEVRIPYDLVKDFQFKYFRAFPMIPEWHKWVKKKLYNDGWITTFMGRQRHFMGRRWEGETQRSAIAFEPQGAIGDYMNKGLLNVWKATHSDPRLSGVDLLLQVHDAIVFQYPEEREAEIIPLIRKHIEIEVPLLHGRTLTIPTDAMVGWNWGYKTDNNPDGLVKYGNDTRKRSAKLSFLDRKFH